MEGSDKWFGTQKTGAGGVSLPMLPPEVAGRRRASVRDDGGAQPLRAWRTPREKEAVQRAGDSHGQSRNFPTIRHTNRAAQGSAKDPCPPRRQREGGKEEEDLIVTITQPKEEHPMSYFLQRGPSL